MSYHSLISSVTFGGFSSSVDVITVLTSRLSISVIPAELVFHYALEIYYIALHLEMA